MRQTAGTHTDVYILTRGSEMTGGTILLLFVGVSTLAMFWGMAYGDYKTNNRWFWQSKFEKTNSGAKFG